MMQELIIRLHGFQKLGEKVNILPVLGVLGYTFMEAMLSLLIVMYYYKHGLVSL